MSAYKLLSDRVPFVPFPQRPVLKAPPGKRMLVWVIVNVEHWSIERAMPRTVLPPPMGQNLLPDLANWSWHEYGMRAGFWRLFDALKQRGITPTLATNGIVCESYPQVAEAALKEGWEFMGHGWIQGPSHKVDNQAEAIAKTMDARLEDKALELDSSDPAKAKAIRETALFYVRQRTQDLLTQMAVTVQGYLALDLVKKNNVELVKGVDRASTTTAAP